MTRLIKKYSNRRLYDTELSCYVSTADVKELVERNVEFVVQDAKTGEDLTRSVLLQIITEQENHTDGSPLFSTKILADMIRTHGLATQEMMGQFLESNVAAFIEMQKKLNEQAQSALILPTNLLTQMMSLQTPVIEKMVKAYYDNATMFSIKKKTGDK